MRPQKVDDQEVMAGLMTVIRAKGYDGATMNDLAEATGLKKASLYHRFPGGKKEITEAVLDHTRSWSLQHISGVLKDKSRAPEYRLKAVIDNIRLLYDDGQAICILRALTMDSSLPLFGVHLEGSFKTWLEAFAHLGTDFGFDQEKSERLATEVLIKVQGSLVLAKGLNDPAPFQQSLSDIEKLYQ